MTHVTDVVIVGAGPTGLFTIFECGMQRLFCHVFDTLDVLGGQCQALYPEKPIYDIPAHPQISGEGLVQNLIEQAKPFKPVYHLSEQVVSLQQDLDKKLIVVTGSKGTIVEAKAMVIAAGVGAFGPNRPPLDHIEDYEGISVHYYVKSRQTYHNKDIVIAGGGDSAVDWALSLCEIAKSVTVVHRRPKFRASNDSEAKLNQFAESGHIQLAIPYQLKGLAGENGHLHSVTIESLSGDQKILKVDYLLPFFGLSMNLGPITTWGLQMNKQHVDIDPLTGATSIPGIYAVGDIATYPHKLKLILTGFAEGAQTAHAIRRYLYPDEIVHFEYSTTKGVP